MFANKNAMGSVFFYLDRRREADGFPGCGMMDAMFGDEDHRTTRSPVENEAQKYRGGSK